MKNRNFEKQKNAFLVYVYMNISAKFQVSSLIRLRVITRTDRQTISTWQKPPNSNSQHTANEAEKSQHFLIQYLENMRADLTKSIEMKIESALQYRAEKKEGPYLTTPPEAAKPDSQSQDPNPYQHQTQPDTTPTLTSMGLIPTTQHQFQPQHQPLNLSQPMQMQNQIPFLHMY